MVARYGVSRYGMGNYSAAITRDMAASVDASAALSTGPINRLRAFGGSVNTTFTFGADLKTERWFKGTAEVNITSEAGIVYLLNKALAGVAEVSISTEARLKFNWSMGGSASLDITYEASPYLGKYWKPEVIPGSWTLENMPGGIWEPEQTPSIFWTPEQLSQGNWVPEQVNDRPWG